jgi:hypothetical protein
MNLPKNIICEILYFLNCKEFYKVIKYLKYDIPRQLIIYNKYNNSLKKLKMINVCNCKIEYLEIVKFLHNIGTKCSPGSIDWASWYGHINTIRYLHSIGEKCRTSALTSASANGHLETVKYLHSIYTFDTYYAIIWAGGNGHLEIVKFLETF